MTAATETARMLLSYELKDDPGQEHEVEVDSVDQARARLAGSSDMVVWASLTDEQGIEMGVDLV